MKTSSHTRIRKPKKPNINFHDILIGIQEGIIVLTNEGKFVYVNEIAAQICGFDSPKILLNTSLHKIAERLDAHDEHGNRISPLLRPSTIALNAKTAREDVLRIKTGTDYKWVRVKSTPILDKNNKVKLIVNILHDFTSQKIVRMELEESERRFRFLTNSIPQIIWTADANGNIDYFNSKWYEYTGVRHRNTKDKLWRNTLHPNDEEITEKKWLRSVKTGEEFEIKHRMGNVHSQRYKWFLTRALPYTDEYGNIIKWFGSSTDIDKQRSIEQKYKKLNEKSKSSLKEKEVLLKEIHHRVKNNLQVVSSLLSLQSINIKDPKLLEMFKDSQARIRSMALIHKNLYQSDDLAHVNFSEYIKSLTDSLLHSFIVNEERIKIELYIQNISINIDQAVPLGLIINELISNCFKYAFPNNRKGIICVEINDDDENHIIIIKDNGVGIPESVNIEETESMGLQLVHILTQQLGGHIVLNRKNGTEFKIIFEKISDEKENRDI